MISYINIAIETNQTAGKNNYPVSTSKAQLNSNSNGTLGDECKQQK